MDDVGMHWTDADFTCLTRTWVTTSVQTNGRTKGFTFYQKVNIIFNSDPECLTRRSCGSTKSQWYVFNAQCVAYKGIVAQERFRNSSRKIEEDQENDAHKIYKSLNGGNDFKHREAYKILVREPRWVNLRDDGLNHAAIEGVTASGSGIQIMLDELWLEKIQEKEENDRRRTEVMQHWQAKIDLEQANEDHKIMEKDLSTLSGDQLQYYLQRQAEIMKRLAKKGGPGT
ncbi:hypothetical protein GIB67_022701 [Kingdonia uniflora]|uniref:No apical meristem-associated C-terminal domain-containing protein n=1 Tax=Kingdonia uniflora TaxID=39325 RepID=A0A7J7P8E0_9MAGN|nr:hypothetical protein GIB67_022701 [Kingdonia uniflora]